MVTLGFLVTWRIVDAFLWRLEAGVQRDMAQRCFGHLIGQSADFHANNFGGSLVSQTNKLMGSYVRIQDTTLFQLIPLSCHEIRRLFTGLSRQAAAPAAQLHWSRWRRRQFRWRGAKSHSRAGARHGRNARWQRQCARARFL